MSFKAVTLLTALIVAVTAQRLTQPTCGSTDVALIFTDTSIFDSYVREILSNFGGQYRVVAVQASGNPVLINSNVAANISSFNDFTDWRSSVASTRISKRGFVNAIDALNALPQPAPSRRIVVVFYSSAWTPTDDWRTVISGSRMLKENPNIQTQVFVVRNAGSSNDEYLRQIASAGDAYFPPASVNPASFVFTFSTGRMVDTVTARCHVSGFPSRVSTFDGATYPFPGVGPYWLMKNVGQSDGIQIEMGNCFSSSPSTGAGSCLRGISFSNNWQDKIYFDAAQNSLFVPSRTRRNLASGCSSLGTGSVCVSEVSLPGTTENVLFVSFSYNSANIVVQALFGRNIPTHVAVDISDEPSLFGYTQGLCGVWDGCAAADLYSRDQKFSVASDVAGTFNHFTESWRPSFDDPQSISYNWNSYYDGPIWRELQPPTFSPSLTTEVSETALENCAPLAAASSYFHQVCLESTTRGYPQVRNFLLAILVDECTDFCQQYPFSTTNYRLDRVINRDYCLRQCRVPQDVDFFVDYVIERNPPSNPTQSNINNWAWIDQDEYSATFWTPIGGRYTVALENGFCDERVVGQINIVCDNTPSVNAGDDRVVKRGRYGWPAIFLSGSASDKNTNKLQYEWRFVEWPVQSNASDSYLVPTDGYNPSITQITPPQPSNSLYATWVPIYPGRYVLELSVFDGCSFSNDTVVINVQCEDCRLPYSSTPLSTFVPYRAGAIDRTTTATGYEYHWTTSTAMFLVSNSNGYLQDSSLSGSTRTVSLYERTYLNQFGQNITFDNTVISHFDDTDDDDIGLGIYQEKRAEGFRRTVTYETEVERTVTTTYYYDSIDQDFPRCDIQILNQNGNVATVRVQNDYAFNDNNNGRIFPSRYCLGNYVSRRDRVETSTGCGGRTEVELPFSVRCGATPRAHLTTCVTEIPFDYSEMEFPSFTLDARDTTDTDTSLANLWLYYEVNRPGSDFSLSAAQYCQGSATACFQRTFTPLAEGSFEITLWASDTCTNSNDTVTIITTCNAITPVTAATVTLNDNSTPFNQATLNGASSSITNGTINYQWRVVAYPQLQGAQLPTLTNSLTDEAILTVFRGGAYTVEFRVGDGCGFRYVNTTVNYICNFEVTPRATISATTSVYDGDTNSYPGVTLSADTTTATADVSRVTYTWNVVSSPVPVNPAGWGIVHNFVPTVAGTYTFTVTVDDGCRVATSTAVTVVASCPTIPAITSAGTSGTHTIQRPSESTVYVGLSATHTPATLPDGVVTMFEVYDPNGQPLTVTVNQTSPLVAFILASVDGVYNGVYTATYNNAGQTAGCVQTLVREFSFTVGCAVTTNVNEYVTQTVTFNRGKFPRVSFATRFTPASSADYLGDGQWIVQEAPTLSVFHAYFNQTSVSDDVVSNSTTGIVNVIPNTLWSSTRTLVTRETTVAVSSFVILENLAEANVDRFSICFTPDRPGRYVLRYSNVDLCGGRVFSRDAIVDAVCNTAPVANAGQATRTVAYNRNGFEYIKLDGTGSSDPNGDSIVWQLWEAVQVPAGSALNDTTTTTLTNPNSLVASFRPDKVGRYVFRLSVSDGCSVSTATTTIDVSCTSGAVLEQSAINYQFNGYTPLSFTHFTLISNPRCDFDYQWTIIDYQQPIRNNPAPVQNDDESSASTMAMSSVFALICVIIALFF